MAGITYELLDVATGAHKAWLTQDGTAGGAPFFVGAEPVFSGQLNTGAGQLQLQMDRWPGATSMVYGDLVRITLPDGTVMGRWKYEGLTGDKEQADRWLVNLMPLAAELKDVDYAANYTIIAQPGQPALGTTFFDTPVVAAVPTTKHCTLTAHANDAAHYALFFASTGRTVVDTLGVAVGLGGLDWWWYCDGDGNVELRHNGRRTVNITRATMIAWEKFQSGIDRLYNVQPLRGGTDASGSTIITTRTITAGSYGTTALGRRVAPLWSDSTIGDLATLQRLGDAILARSQVIPDARQLRLVNAPILKPGDQVTITDPDLSVGGPWYVTDWHLYGSTGVQEISISTQYGVYDRSALAAAQSLQSQLLTGPGLTIGAGGICGGYQPLGRLIPASLTSSHLAGTEVLVALEYILDSGGQCQVECKAYGAIRIAPTSPPATPYSLRLLSDLTQDGSGAVASGVPIHIEADGLYHPFAFFVPSGQAVADATYYAYLYVEGPAAAIDLDYDLQVWLYSGGQTLSP